MSMHHVARLSLVLIVLLLPASLPAASPSLLKAGTTAFRSKDVAAGLQTITRYLNGIQGHQVPSALFTSITGNRLYMEDPEVRAFLNAARSESLNLSHPALKENSHLMPLVEYLEGTQFLNETAVANLTTLLARANMTESAAQRMATCVVGGLDSGTLRIIGGTLDDAARFDATPLPREQARPEVVAVIGGLVAPRLIRTVFSDAAAYARGVQNQANELHGPTQGLRLHLDSLGTPQPAPENGWFFERDPEGNVVGYGEHVEGRKIGIQVRWSPEGQLESVEYHYYDGLLADTLASKEVRFEDGRPSHVAVSIPRTGWIRGSRSFAVDFHANGMQSRLSVSGTFGTRWTSFDEAGGVQSTQGHDW